MMIGSTSSWQAGESVSSRAAVPGACVRQKKAKMHNNPSSQVEVDGYLNLETGSWEGAPWLQPFSPFSRSSGFLVALSRTSSTNFSTLSPHPNINPSWSTPAHRTGRDPQSTNTRGIAAERSPSQLHCAQRTAPAAARR